MDRAREKASPLSTDELKVIFEVVAQGEPQEKARQQLLRRDKSTVNRAYNVVAEFERQGATELKDDTAKAIAEAAKYSSTISYVQNLFMKWRAWKAAGLPTSSRPSPERDQLEHNGVSLAPWVASAQEKHLEGEFRDGEVVTAGVRQHLEAFKKVFLEIDPELRTYYRENVASKFLDELRGHLPHEKFWGCAKQFAQKAGKTDKLLGALDQEIRRNAEQQVAPVSKTGREDTPCITSVFVTKVVNYALAPHLGEAREAPYQWVEQADQPGFVELDGYIIARGIHAEASHWELTKRYRGDARIKAAALLMGELRSLRESILGRIDRCLYGRGYIHYYCSSCPAAWPASP